MTSSITCIDGKAKRYGFMLEPVWCVTRSAAPRFRYGALANTLHTYEHKCDRGIRYGAFNIPSYTSRHHHDSGGNNSSPCQSRLGSCSSGYCSHPADGSCFGLPALPVSLPQQRRLQDDRGGGSGGRPR
ncbi:hypothetical protein PFLUV_G00054490 [Perca fluviatilis]|uniref:Uncharacterized protein n=1 Tax=Perca fluviatilis TaxID=8168 RepID=A0A6A5FCG0_PERFL|nr:hypothetical protein PFLUV_G00054490 [Perca fluviatilis]